MEPILSSKVQPDWNSNEKFVFFCVASLFQVWAFWAFELEGCHKSAWTNEQCREILRLVSNVIAVNYEMMLIRDVISWNRRSRVIREVYPKIRNLSYVQVINNNSFLSKDIISLVKYSKVTFKILYVQYCTYDGRRRLMIYWLTLHRRSLLGFSDFEFLQALANFSFIWSSWKKGNLAANFAWENEKSYEQIYMS